MLKKVNKGWLWVCLLFTLSVNCAFGQNDGNGSVKIDFAPQQANNNSNTNTPPTDPVEYYKNLYGISPDSVYTEYIHALIDAKKYSDAEKIIDGQIKNHPQDPTLLIDLGNAYELQKKESKAKTQFDKGLDAINGDDMLTQRIANAYISAGRDDYAILTYEKATKILNVSYFYSGPLAKLYAKTGALDKAIDIMLIQVPGMGVNLDNVKTVLLELLGNDPDKLRMAQKALIAKINAEPNNFFYADLLTWIYTQKNDWDEALMQMEAVDERNNEGGRRVVELARNAANAKQYDVALKAYDDVIDKGKTVPYYMLARSEKLNVALARLQNDSVYKPEDVVAVRVLYDSFLSEFPKYYCQQTASDFALLEAKYDNNVDRAIEILNKAIADPDTRLNMMGEFKLQLGDYYVLIGRVWDASLTYSQVDKAFKQDPQGEDARFRNAKLAYYRGDFDWAQHQLERLKSATSELISNDAIYLSVLITENVEDSDKVPLQRFAYAGLLLFQNKDRQAETLLDSINKAYPKHPLNDDILMMRAEIAEKHRDYTKAIDYLNTIYQQYGQDVLGDDAVFKMATIYQDDLHQPDKAKHYYEQLIIDYPGSTYVQTARQKLAALNNGTIP